MSDCHKFVKEHKGLASLMQIVGQLARDTQGDGWKPQQQMMLMAADSEIDGCGQ